MQHTVAVIVGAGPAGLATAASLNLHSIPHVLLEREDRFAPLWSKYAYDRLHLHLRKQFCELPHMQFPDSFPEYVPKDQFLEYFHHYISHFKISPLYQRRVELATYDEGTKKWTIKARNLRSGEFEEYSARFLVVASGEACDPFIPEVEGLNTFPGEVLHSTRYKNGKPYRGKNVLVVGSGNSGMEIALDLANHEAKTSIVIRSPIHIQSRWMMYLIGMIMRYVSRDMLDSILVMLSKLVYGDLSKYGINRPKEGPFFIHNNYRKYPLIDVGTCKKIMNGEIQVLPAVASIRGNEVLFENGKSHPFDAIIFCTGFKRSTNKWLKGDDYLLDEDGFSKPSPPNHWKGKNGLYCNGTTRRGLFGIKVDSPLIADDIKSLM